MEFKQLIEERRSIRKYEGPIPHEDLVAILTQAQQSPSWANLQAYKSYVVEDPALIREFSKRALPEGNQVRSANAVLLVSTYLRDTVSFSSGKQANEIGNGWAAYDLGLHDAYLVLAAKDAGYDTLIMGIRDADVIREKLNVPDTEEIMSVIAVGKRGAAPTMRPRKELGEVAKFF